MEFKIIEERENPLLNRKEITYEIREEIIPSKETVKGELSKKYKFDKDLIEILRISGKFGVKIFEVVVHVYHNKEEMGKTVLRSKKQRDEEAKALEEAKKAQEEAKVEAEKPEEEVKEAAEKPREESEEGAKVDNSQEKPEEGGEAQ